MNFERVTIYYLSTRAHYNIQHMHNISLINAELLEMWVYKQRNVYTYICTYVYIHMYVCIYVHTHVHNFFYTYTHTHTHTHTYTHTYRETLFYNIDGW